MKKGSSYIEIIISIVLIIAVGAVITSNLRNILLIPDLTEKEYKLNLKAKDILDKIGFYFESDGIEFFESHGDIENLFLAMGVNGQKDCLYEIVIQKIGSNEKFILTQRHNPVNDDSLSFGAEDSYIFSNTQSILFEDILIDQSDGEDKYIDLSGFNNTVTIKYTGSGGRVIISGADNDIYFKVFSSVFPDISYNGRGILYMSSLGDYSDYFVTVNIYNDQEKLIKGLGNLMAVGHG